MRVGIDVVRMERVGLDVVFVAETYGSDAVSQLGYLAAKTERVKPASGIVQVCMRTPALTAMTAAGLDSSSGGRFTLGLGVSGPQVIEGFHGVRYEAPWACTHGVVEICRQLWRGERVVYQGGHYTIPLRSGQDTGLGKPLKLINQPPRNVPLAAEITEGWLPIFFHPDKAGEVWGPALAEGRARRDPALGELDVFASPAPAIGDDVDHLLAQLRPDVALYVGGMGARGKNFYHYPVARYGFEAEASLIQDLYLDGKKDRAAAAVPDELLRATYLVGAGYVKERLAAFAEARVAAPWVSPLQPSRLARVDDATNLRKLLN